MTQFLSTQTQLTNCFTPATPRPATSISARTADEQPNSPRRDAASSPAIEAAKITGLTVEVQTSPNSVGFEIAWYVIRPKSAGIGFDVVPFSGGTAHRGRGHAAAAPATNHLQFPPETAFYRLFYKAEEGTMRDSGTRTHRTEPAYPTLVADQGVCGRLAGGCFLIPKAVAVNPDIVVSVNGRQAALPRRSPGDSGLNPKARASGPSAKRLSGSARSSRRRAGRWSDRSRSRRAGKDRGPWLGLPANERRSRYPAAP